MALKQLSARRLVLRLILGTISTSPGAVFVVMTDWRNPFRLADWLIFGVAAAVSILGAWISAKVGRYQ